jgi:hypothetical protein
VINRNLRIQKDVHPAKVVLRTYKIGGNIGASSQKRTTFTGNGKKASKFCYDNALLKI